MDDQAQFDDLPRGAKVVSAPGGGDAGGQYSDLPTGATVIHAPSESSLSPVAMGNQALNRIRPGLQVSGREFTPRMGRPQTAENMEYAGGGKGKLAGAAEGVIQGGVDLGEGMLQMGKEVAHGLPMVNPVAAARLVKGAASMPAAAGRNIGSTAEAIWRNEPYTAGEEATQGVANAAGALSLTRPAATLAREPAVQAIAGAPVRGAVRPINNLLSTPGGAGAAGAMAGYGSVAALEQLLHAPGTARLVTPWFGAWMGRELGRKYLTGAKLPGERLGLGPEAPTPEAPYTPPVFQGKGTKRPGAAGGPGAGGEGPGVEPVRTPLVKKEQTTQTSTPEPPTPVQRFEKFEDVDTQAQLRRGLEKKPGRGTPKPQGAEEEGLHAPWDRGPEGFKEPGIGPGAQFDPTRRAFLQKAGKAVAGVAAGQAGGIGGALGAAGKLVKSMGPDELYMKFGKFIQDEYGFDVRDPEFQEMMKDARHPKTGKRSMSSAIEDVMNEGPDPRGAMTRHWDLLKQVVDPQVIGNYLGYEKVGNAGLGPRGLSYERQNLLEDVVADRVRDMVASTSSLPSDAAVSKAMRESIRELAPEIGRPEARARLQRKQTVKRGETGQESAGGQASQPLVPRPGSRADLLEDQGIKQQIESQPEVAYGQFAKRHNPLSKRPPSHPEPLTYEEAPMEHKPWGGEAGVRREEMGGKMREVEFGNTGKKAQLIKRDDTARDIASRQGSPEANDRFYFPPSTRAKSSTTTFHPKQVLSVEGSAPPMLKELKKVIRSGDWREIENRYKSGDFTQKNTGMSADEAHDAAVIPVASPRELRMAKSVKKLTDEELTREYDKTAGKNWGDWENQVYNEFLSRRHLGGFSYKRKTSPLEKKDE